MTERIVIVDYGSGNLRSVQKAFERVAAGRPTATSIIVTDKAEEIAAADRVVLPGVGAFAACMAGLKANPDIIPALEHAVLVNGQPFLGICVGMQLLASRGLEFDETVGLGWIAGDVKPLTPAPDHPVPHMGWNNVVLEGNHPVFASASDGGDFYFVHSYHFDVENISNRIAVCDYGTRVTAAVTRDNLVGVQFHPEKSQQAGLSLIDRFLQWCP